MLNAQKNQSKSIVGLFMAHLLTAAIVAHATLAFAANFDPPVTILSDDNIYTVNRDGTSTLDQTRSIRIENDQGVKSYGQISYRYSNDFQKLDVVEAYTTTRDGERIDVSPNAIFTRQSAVSAYAPTFDDNLVKTIVFPGIEPGATVTMHTRETRVTP